MERTIIEPQQKIEDLANSDIKHMPDGVKLWFVIQFDESNIDDESEAIQRRHKECMDYCCDVLNDVPSHQVRAYFHYCGTKLYPQNWYAARDDITIFYEATGDPTAANTLGYIYYYGRCNNGVREYDKAFKYFSIGHAAGLFESTYKLADMLARGLGCVKNPEIAFDMYLEVYRKNRVRFLSGDEACKLADAAYRMGKCFQEGIGVEPDFEAAYAYYLEADYAITRRLATIKYYGDTTVQNNIKEALLAVRRDYTDTGSIIETEYPEFFSAPFEVSKYARLTITPLGNDVLALDLTPLPAFAGGQPPKMLITMPQADFCKPVEKIQIETTANSTFRTFDGGTELQYDDWSYDWTEQRVTLYLMGEIVAQIKAEGWRMTAPR